MFRHFNAPTRCFSQISNELIRHPRLSSDALRLLLWQLSLPEGADESLSRTARRANIKPTAFKRAKRLLIEERFLHEKKVQGRGGLWRTLQLISGTPLTAAEASGLLNGRSATAGSPTADSPTVGAPAPRPVGRQPRRNTPKGNTPQPSAVTTAPAAAAAAPAPGAAREEAGRQLLLSLRESDSRLAMSERKAARWAPLAARWLDSGLTGPQVRDALTADIQSARSPLAVLRWRLKHELPAPAPESEPKPASRAATMRECPGDGPRSRPHLFTPSADETRCPACAAAPAEEPSRTEGPGFRAYVAARAKFVTPALACPT